MLLVHSLARKVPLGGQCGPLSLAHFGRVLGERSGIGNSSFPQRSSDLIALGLG